MNMWKQKHRMTYWLGRLFVIFSLRLLGAHKLTLKQYPLYNSNGVKLLFLVIAVAVLQMLWQQPKRLSLVRMSSMQNGVLLIQL